MRSDILHQFGPQRGPASVARIEAQRKAILWELESMRDYGSFVCSRCGEKLRYRDDDGNAIDCPRCELLKLNRKENDN